MWDVSRVKSMSRVFDGANAFNQDISGWAVSSVLDMSHMFDSASSFDQNICEWGYHRYYSQPLASNGMFFRSGCPHHEEPYAYDDERYWCHCCTCGGGGGTTFSDSSSGSGSSTVQVNIVLLSFLATVICYATLYFEVSSPAAFYQDDTVARYSLNTTGQSQYANQIHYN